MVSKLCEGEGGTLTLVSGGGYSSDITDRTVGIFGTNTRKHVMDSGLKADYLFNGFESCVVDCLKGKDSVLVYDDECRSLVESKLRNLERFGGSIRCIDGC